MSAIARRFIPFAALLFGVSLLPAAELVTTAGKKIPVELVAIGDKKIDFLSNSRNDSLLLTQILQIDFQAFKKDAPKEKTTLVELVDGTRLRATAFRIKGKNAEIDLYGAAIAKPLVVPLNHVYWLFREPDAAKMYLDFQTLVKRRGKRDVMVMRKADGIDGIEGSFGEADAAGETIDFEIAGGVRGPIKVSRVLGMIFNQPPEGDRATTLCKLIDKSGNSFTLKAIQIAGQNLKWTTVTGLEATDFALANVARLDFSSGTMRYLSDLDPVGLVQSSTNGFDEPIRRDANLDGREIAIKKEKFAKGLTLHSRTVATYDVDGYREFRAVVGVDDELAADCKAILKIEADGKVVLTQAVAKGDPPKPITLGIQNIKSLRITVESELLDLNNQVSLGDARIIK